MKVIYARDVNDAYQQGVTLLHAHGELAQSRAGEVLVMPCPVTTVYQSPCERVLFCKRRDANPFFHLFESLWMLAGRDDAAFLNRFVGDFGERFGEDGGHIHGAYGFRWRNGFGYDQLEEVIKKLRTNPQDRQAVIQMWDAHDNGFCGFDDLCGPWKDRPCNTHIYLRVHEEVTDYGALEHGLSYTSVKGYNRHLDLTVCCRSNDIIWGAYGANAVHFSVLLEYLAGRIGVRVGKMYQVSNNYHAYIDVLDKVGTPAPYFTRPYEAEGVRAEPMGTDWISWDADLYSFMDWATHEGIEEYQYANEWFKNTAEPLFHAHIAWKSKYRDKALSLVADERIAPDWRKACLEWMERRLTKTSVPEVRAK